MDNIHDTFLWLNDRLGRLLNDIAIKAYIWMLYLTSLTSFSPPPPVQHPVALENSADVCANLQSSFRFENTTIISTTTVPVGTLIDIPGSCQSSAVVDTSICRVYLSVRTSETSVIHAEAWLPDVWYGRFLSLGNGGLGGCIDYRNLNYGTTMHFAAIGTDNGHDGMSGAPFLNNPEVMADFAHRSIHVEALVGKALVAAYYGRPHDKSYYLSCSTGGRQGMYSALHFPEDFDGIIAGAPATDFNHLVAAEGLISRTVGALDGEPRTSARFVPPELWRAVHEEVMRQCDALDGVQDGIITEPDACLFRPEALQCGAEGVDAAKCLTLQQVKAVRKVYEPHYDANGELLYPRWDPGSEEEAIRYPFLGPFFIFSLDWYKYTIHNDSDHDFSDWGLKDVHLADTINPGGIDTFRGDMSAFKARGGKFITYHGRMDGLIPSGSSKRMYNLIARTMGQSTLDDFYRLFLIPGLGHCTGGPGAMRFGHYGADTNAVNDSSHNALLALVDWVEAGVAPAEIVGSGAEGAKAKERSHCRYPMRSVLEGRKWICSY